MAGVFFIPFPKPKTKREKCIKWISLCGRPHKNFNIQKINEWTYICSKHFVGGAGPTDLYPDPIPAIQVGSLSPAVAKKARKSRIKDHSSPSSSSSHFTFEHDYCSLPSSVTNDVDFIVGVVDASIGPDVDMDISSDDDILVTPILADATVQVGTTSCDMGTQSTPTKVDACTQTDEECDAWMRRSLFMENITISDKTCMFWTGVMTLSTLNFIFEWVSPCAEQMTLWMGKKRHNERPCKPRKRILSLFEEFVLVLVRIRRGLDTEVLATLMGISQAHVCKIFISWVNLLHKCFLPLLEWPTADIVSHNMPKSFRKHFPSTRVIIDCSELFVQTPRALHAQRTTWSSYKSHNTFKFLLGIAPSGQITFLSKLFCGSISDREIVIKSQFLELIERNDNVMADRGFNIRDLLLRKHAFLNIPAFSDGKQLSARAVLKSRRIASVRIHVERAMERIKNYKIIQGVLPLKLKNSIDQVLTICAVLSNLQDPLVNE